MNTRTISSQPEQRYRRFEKHIWRNPAICNNCFTRLKHIIPVDVELHQRLSDDSISVPSEAHFRTGASCTGFQTYEDPTDSSVVIPVFRATTSCRECGSVGGIADPTTLTRKKALKMVTPLRQRLEEDDFRVDEDEMRKVVWKAKSRRRLQGYDREIFGLATRRATVRGGD